MRAVRALMGACGIVLAMVAAFATYNNSTVAGGTQGLAFAVTSIAFFKASDFFKD